MKTKQKPIYLWKSMREGLKSNYGLTDWKVGKWFVENGDIIACENGFHASENIIDAMNYVPCGVLCKVEVRGTSDKKEDKQAWSEMRIVEAYEWTKRDSVEFAVYAAELVIDIFEKKYPNDKRPREAIEVAKKYLNGEAFSAFSAYAADAVYAAAYAAYATADAIKQKCHDWILERIKNKTLKPYDTKSKK